MPFIHSLHIQHTVGVEFRGNADYKLSGRDWDEHANLVTAQDKHTSFMDPTEGNLVPYPATGLLHDLEQRTEPGSPRVYTSTFMSGQAILLPFDFYEGMKVC